MLAFRRPARMLQLLLAVILAAAPASADEGPSVAAPPARAMAPTAGPGAAGPPLARPTPGTEGETEPAIEAEAQPEPEAAAPPSAASSLPGPLPRPGPPPAPPEPDEAAPVVLPDRPAPGWTLRTVPDGSPLAFAGGPGQVLSLAAFCLGGRPWLALDLVPAPAAEQVRADFAAAGARIEATAIKEEGAGGAFVIELGEGPLLDLLAGPATSAILAIDGTQQGQLSLEGASRALRAALAPCHAF